MDEEALVIYGKVPDCEMHGQSTSDVVEIVDGWMDRSSIQE